MTVDELLAACAGIVDVSVDIAARDLDLVLERVRSLGVPGRVALRDAIWRAIANAKASLRESEWRDEALREKLAEWRQRRAEAEVSAPELVPEVDVRIAELELALADTDRHEYQASLDELQRALAVVERA